MKTRPERCRRLTGHHPPRYEYFLTDNGKARELVLMALYTWGERCG
jgi:DNA-binding HxlR family transcriptional regulator